MRMVSLYQFIKNIVKEHGLWWVVQRAFYEGTVISGWKKYTFQPRSWGAYKKSYFLKSAVFHDEKVLFDQWKNTGSPYVFNVLDLFPHRDAYLDMIGENGLKKLKQEADSILAGTFTFFFATQYDIGFPPQWFYNPMTKCSVAGDRHWSSIKMHDDTYGDLKYIWEPSRFASAYVLSRAWFATAEEKYAEGFWLLVEDWYNHNPPNSGPNWKCGQEAGIRVLAWCFALQILKHSKATTPHRFAVMLTLIATHGERIKADHLYAHLQKNNHSMSEGAALFTIGLLFPQLKNAGVWARAGKKILEKEARALVRQDGTFIQKSHNYHRLMLQLYIHSIQLAKVHGQSFSKEMRFRIEKASQYIYQVIDDTNGKVPNFGANDGALIMPLTVCDYYDFRSVTATAYYLFTGERIFGCGPWDEELYWLFGPVALEKPARKPEKVDYQASDGGIYVFRNTNTCIFTHCENIISRPGHADCLHLDVWWKGFNIACDAGTYLYYGNKPWNDGLKGTAIHNTVTIDSKDQMDRGPRFLWTNWHKARVNSISDNKTDSFKYFEGEHEGYKRLPDPVLHRRAIILDKASDMIIVFDDLIGILFHQCSLQWLFNDFPYHFDKGKGMLTLNTPAGMYTANIFMLSIQKEILHNVCRGAENNTTTGWISGYYGVKYPGIRFTTETEGILPCRFMTILAPTKDINAHIQDNTVSINHDVKITLSNAGNSPLVQNVHFASIGNSETFFLKNGVL